MEEMENRGVGCAAVWIVLLCGLCCCVDCAAVRIVVCMWIVLYSMYCGWTVGYFILNAQIRQ